MCECVSIECVSVEYVNVWECSSSANRSEIERELKTWTAFCCTIWLQNMTEWDRNRVTRLCDFWNLFGTKFPAKEAQIFSNIFGSIVKNGTFMLNWYGYFLGNFIENWATFYSNIWSHWIERKRERDSGKWRKQNESKVNSVILLLMGPA